MAIKVRMKNTEPEKAISSTPSLKIPRITGAPPRTPNIIIRAVKIMLMDIRKHLYPKQTAEDFSKYSQFSDYAYGRR